MTRSSTHEFAELRPPAGAGSISSKYAVPEVPASFVWQSWPIVDEWRRCAPVAATTAIVSLAIGLTLGSLNLALLTCAVQAIVLWRLWLPIRYEIKAQGIEQRILGRTRLAPWPAIRRCELRDDGVLLFRNADPRPFDSWRGMYLPWNRHRAAVLAALNAQISPSEATVVN